MTQLYRERPARPLSDGPRDAPCSGRCATRPTSPAPNIGCGTGHCGACTVHVDGNAVRSCRVPISALEGSFVTTIEGLSRDRSHPVQQAFVADMVVAMRLLHPGRDHGRRRSDRPQRQPDRRADRRRDHQHLPLRHLSAAARIDPPRDPDQDRARGGGRRAAARHRARRKRRAPCRRCARSRAGRGGRGPDVLRHSATSCRLAYRPVQQPVIRESAQAVS